MSNYDAIHKAIGDILDILWNDEKAVEIIKGIDKAKSDAELKSYIKQALNLIAENDESRSLVIKASIIGWLSY